MKLLIGLWKHFRNAENTNVLENLEIMGNHKLHINMITATATSLLDAYQSNRLILFHVLFRAKIIFLKNRIIELLQNGFLYYEAKL